MRTASPSIYQRVLGDRFAQLHPGLRAYFGALPPGTAGVGRGVYDIVGSRWRMLRPVLAVFASRNVLFPERAHDVPFTVVNVPDGDGALRSIRSFFLPARTRVMEDTMTAVGERIVDRLGRRRGLEATLAVDVVDGGLRMRSERLALWIRGCRVPLPRVATVTVDESWTPAGQRVDVCVRALIVGEVFRYTGTFRYEHVPVDGVPPAATSS